MIKGSWGQRSISYKLKNSFIALFDHCYTKVQTIFQCAYVWLENRWGAKKMRSLIMVIWRKKQFSPKIMHIFAISALFRTQFFFISIIQWRDSLFFMFLAIFLSGIHSKWVFPSHDAVFLCLNRTIN